MLAAGAAVAGASPGWYASLRRPGWAPPPAAFPPVWTALDLGMALAAWLVWRRPDVALHRKQAALRAWGWQLLVSAAWPPVFFAGHALGVATGLSVALAIATAVTLRRFGTLHRGAAALLWPYLAWVLFACGLCAEFWRLNAN